MKRIALVFLLIVFTIRCNEINQTFDNGSNEIPSVYNKYSSKIEMNLKNQYFIKLNEESSIENKYGSCAYTSMTMLLSYYDSFYDGNIIDDSYQKSVSLYDDTIIKCPGVIINSYKNEKEFYENNKDNTFLGKLFEFYYQDIHLWPGPKSGKFGLTKEDVYSILKKYFKMVYDDSNMVQPLDSLDKIKDKIKEGIPVIIRGEDDNGEGHSFVGYELCGDDIVCNLGWGENYSASNGLDRFHKGVFGYYIKNDSKVHKCTKMFGLNNCLCKYTNLHSIKTKVVNKQYHMISCGCMEDTVEEHQFVVSGLYHKCKVCSYMYKSDEAIIYKKKEDIL